MNFLTFLFLSGMLDKLEYPCLTTNDNENFSLYDVDH